MEYFICYTYNCWYNDKGFCISVSDLWNPELGKDCPDYEEII